MRRAVDIIEQLERSAIQARRSGRFDAYVSLLEARARLVRASQRNSPDVERIHRDAIELLKGTVDVGILDLLIAAMEGLTVKRVGFWWSKMEPWLPRAQDHVDASWNLHERAMVIRYLERPTHKSEAFFGESNCRFCGKANGCRDVTDGVYVWPDGLSHYLRSHGVKPPAEFIEHVRNPHRVLR